MLCCSGWAPPGATAGNQGLQSGPFFWGASPGNNAGLSALLAVVRSHTPVFPTLLERPAFLLRSSRFSSAAARRTETVTIYRPVLPLGGPQAAIGLSLYYPIFLIQLFVPRLRIEASSV